MTEFVQPSKFELHHLMQKGVFQNHHHKVDKVEWETLVSVKRWSKHTSSMFVGQDSSSRSSGAEILKMMNAWEHHKVNTMEWELLAEKRLFWDSNPCASGSWQVLSVLAEQPPVGTLYTRSPWTLLICSTCCLVPRIPEPREILHTTRDRWPGGPSPWGRASGWSS